MFFFPLTSQPLSFLFSLKIQGLLGDVAPEHQGTECLCLQNIIDPNAPAS